MISKKNDNRLKAILSFSLFVLIEGIFVLLLFLFSNKYLYSSYNKDLIIIVLTSLFCILFSLGARKKLFNILENKLIKSLLNGLCIICIAFSFVYIGKSIYAFRYENSKEVYRLSSNMSVLEAKKIKKTIDNIFEKDFLDVFSRDIVIDNYYYDEDKNVYMLYLNDYYKNYKLKFFVEMDEFEVINIYWQYNGDILYFVHDGEKTSDFEFFYAMYILNEVIGEETRDVVTFEDTVETKMKKHFVDSTSIIVSYENLNYHKDTNSFILECRVAAMNFNDDVIEDDFEIIFNGVSSNDVKDIWYYGDSSFDFVNYNINI